MKRDYMVQMATEYVKRHPETNIDAVVTHIETYLQAYQDGGVEFPRSDDWTRFLVGTSAETMSAKAREIAARTKRRAGVKALERKYGHEVAAKIVYKHSGRRIQ